MTAPGAKARIFTYVVKVGESYARRVPVGDALGVVDAVMSLKRAGVDIALERVEPTEEELILAEIRWLREQNRALRGGG